MDHYLYGLVPADAQAPAEPGVAGAEVTLAPAAHDLAVLRSGFDGGVVQPRRAHLLAHDRVLAAAMAAGAVLPFRFGMVTGSDPAGVLDGLEPAVVHERMAALAGRVEVQLLWEPDEDTALRRVVERRPEVRDRSLAAVDRGRLVAEATADLAVADLTAVRDRIADLAVATGEVEHRGTSARVAVLVDEDDLDELVARCADLGDRAAGAGTLRTVGALPPYSFVDLGRQTAGV